MAELEQIQNLQKIISDIISVTSALDKQMAELKNIVDTGNFIPQMLSTDIRKSLEEINERQMDLTTQFEQLGFGELPVSISDATEKVHKEVQAITSKEQYYDAIRFFMNLRSADEQVGEVLEAHKKNINVEALFAMELPQLKEQTVSYLQLKEAFLEENPKKKFSYMLKLSNAFDEQILMGLNFGTIFLDETDDNFSFSAVHSEKIGDNNHDVVDIDAADELEAENEILVEEPEKTEAKEEIKDEITWADLLVDNPDDIIVPERTDLLHVESSAKAATKFRAKEFKSDITKNYAIEKMNCLLEAFDSCGYTIESIALQDDKAEERYELASNKLYQNGYIKKYSVEGIGEFYCLSERGEKAFSTQGVSSFIQSFFGKNKRFESADPVEDRTNPAIVRVIHFGTYARVRKINPEYKFFLNLNTLSSDYHGHVFMEVLYKKEFFFTSIISENISEYKEYLEYLAENIGSTDVLVLIGMDEIHAKNVLDWVYKNLQDKLENIDLWYCGYKDSEYREYLSGKIVDISQLSEATCEDEEISDGEIIEEMSESEAIEEMSEIEAIEESSEMEDAKESSENEKIEEAYEVKELPKTELLEKAPEIEAVVSVTEEYVETDIDQQYLDMICRGKTYCATAFLKAATKIYPEYQSVYRQLAYAVNDPLESCSYSSDNIFSVYYNEEKIVSEYFVIAAVLRNYFLNQYSYDYSLQQLQSVLAGNSVLSKNTVLDKLVYTLFTFKTEQHNGIDRYADYREKERANWEKRLEETRRDAKEYYDNYIFGMLKENASHKRFIETRRLLFAPNGEMGEYLLAVINDDREWLALIEDYLKQNFVKDGHPIAKENIDGDKIYKILDEYWDRAAENMRVVRKSSDLMSSLRMNLYKQVSKVVSVLCNYVFLIESAATQEDDAGLTAYKKLRTSLLNDLENVIANLAEEKEADNCEKAGRIVLTDTLKEMKSRIDGDYNENANTYFYLGFLKNDKVLLDDDYLPILDNVLELPKFAVMSRIVAHSIESEMDLVERVREIFNGGDDYGSAKLMLKYFRIEGTDIEDILGHSCDLEKAIVYPRKDLENKRNEFIEDIELAQSYGQIDNTSGNVKETIVQIMDIWYQWAIDTMNYGFFGKILMAFREKIKEDAQVRAVELESSLDLYLVKNTDWKDNNLISQAVEQIRERINQQNYAAAEDLLNRLLANDIDEEVEFEQVDYLKEFLEEYEVNYKNTANSRLTLKAVLSNSKLNKDTKAANRLLESWPKGAGVGEYTIRNLLQALGFNTGIVKKEPTIQGKIENYFISLKRPQNGRKSNYKHPIAAFGSEAEEKGFRVVCLFGRADGNRLIDIFKEIGNAKNTLVFVDYSLTLAERRTLARKTKTDLSGKIFAVVDRVVLVYLAKHYVETSVNRMLMSVIMPFASYQPYIDKSADVMPQEMFIGRKNELEEIESPTGVNIVYGGRQLGKTALLRMAKKDIDKNENGDRAIIVNVWKKDYKEAARTISAALYDEKILKKENITENWNELARDIKNRLRDEEDRIPYFLLMIDEADVFIESSEEVEYQPFEALKDIQSIGSGRFKFVVAGLRNIVRFKKAVALGNNSGLTHLGDLTVRPFKAMEARELLEVPLSYLGFRFAKDAETEVLISTIFGTTNYFPGLIQLYCTKLIEAMKRDYAGYTESETPPYIVKKDLIKKVLAEQSLQQDIREKFFITLKVDEDDYYYILALLTANHYHSNKSQNGCSARELLELADALAISKIADLEESKVLALLEEMRELNILQHIGDGRYRFARHSFCQMMGTAHQIDDELEKYMEA